MPKTARSLRRKEAKKLRKQWQRQLQERRNTIKRYAKASIVDLLAILGALGSAATLYGYKTRLSVSPETSQLTSNGLSMPIKVSNDGILTVNNVRFSCVYREALGSNDGRLRNVEFKNFPTQNVPEITPGHPVTLFCEGVG